MSSAFLFILLRHLMPLPRNSQSFPAASWSGVWQIKHKVPLRTIHYIPDHFVVAPCVGTVMALNGINVF
jgi:hypothetical protein